MIATDRSTVVSCPDCPRPARVLQRRTVSSTSGPLDIVRIRCPAGHWYLMPSDDVAPLRLPGGRA